MSTLTALSIIIIASLCFAALFGWLWKREAARRAQLDALAQQRGWTIAWHNSSGGKPARTEIVPAAPTAWRVTITHARNSSSGGRTQPQTVYHDPAITWPSGSAVFGPPIPADAAAMAQMVLGSLDSGMGKMLLEKLLGPGAANLSGLEYVAQPGGAVRSFSMFANVSDIPAGILGRLDGMVQEWAAQHSKDEEQLIIIAGPDGVVVRTRHAIHQASQLEDFVDRAGAIANLLKGPA